jgi:hypothetical protein
MGADLRIDLASRGTAGAVTAIASPSRDEPIPTVAFDGREPLWAFELACGACANGHPLM